LACSDEATLTFDDCDAALPIAKYKLFSPRGARTIRAPRPNPPPGPLPANGLGAPSQQSVGNFPNSIVKRSTSGAETVVKQRFHRLGTALAYLLAGHGEAAAASKKGSRNVNQQH
jgi:hypothetical protein